MHESLEAIFWVKILKFFDAYPGFLMEKIRIRGPDTGTGWEKFGSGIREKTSRIRNTDPCARECPVTTWQYYTWNASSTQRLSTRN